MGLVGTKVLCNHSCDRGAPLNMAGRPQPHSFELHQLARQAAFSPRGVETSLFA